jgi:hypothetical protein
MDPIQEVEHQLKQVIGEEDLSMTSQAESSDVLNTPPSTNTSTTLFDYSTTSRISTTPGGKSELPLPGASPSTSTPLVSNSTLMPAPSNPLAGFLKGRPTVKKRKTDVNIPAATGKDSNTPISHNVREEGAWIGGEESRHVLERKKLQDLLHQIDPREKMDPDVEQVNNMQNL